MRIVLSVHKLMSDSSLQGEAFSLIKPCDTAFFSCVILPYSLYITPPFLPIRFSYKYGGGLIIEYW